MDAVSFTEELNIDSNSLTDRQKSEIHSRMRVAHPYLINGWNIDIDNLIEMLFKLPEEAVLIELINVKHYQIPELEGYTTPKIMEYLNFIKSRVALIIHNQRTGNPIEPHLFNIERKIDKLKVLGFDVKSYYTLVRGAI